MAIIAPFNFPLEIPALQLIGALMSGNKVLVKGDSRVSIVLKKFLELLHHCGLPPLGKYYFELIYYYFLIIKNKKIVISFTVKVQQWNSY